MEKGMKVKVKLVGVSEPPSGFERSKEVPVDFPRNSLGDLVKHLLSGMDSKGREIFLNEQGGISPDLVVIVNGIAVTDSNRFHLRLKEEDRIELVSSPG
jgi:sulfur carrier protein ThiS